MQEQLGQILHTGLGFWSSKVLLSAIEIGVFTELARGPKDLEAIAGRLKLHPRSSRDFLDALVALGFLERENGTYRNTAASDLYLDRRKGSYVGGILEMANNRLYPFWGHLTEALRTGRPQNEAKESGQPPFEALYADPARLREFLSAMTGISRGANVSIAKKFPWKDYSTTVDVGTAQGDLLVQVVEANSGMTGIGFDLPEVEPIFDDYARANGLAKRLRFVAGNFFVDSFPKADVVMMGHILHDWNLEEKKALIRKSYEAVPEGGALLVYESLIDDDRSRNAFGLLMSLNMLIETPGGFDYTGQDCQDWLSEAGFRETRVEHLVGPDSMVIGIK